jgi:3-hydroxyacyl-CoA dehydrogenase
LVDIDNIENIAIIGGGVMGSGIAQVALLAGYKKVTVIDLDEGILRKSKDLIQERIQALESEENYKKFLTVNNVTDPVQKSLNIKRELDKFESVGILAHNVDKKTIISHMKTDTDISKGVEDADFVIEAVSEKLELKQSIFKDLGEYSPSNTILASNTSAMSITKIGQYSGRPEKVIGMHFNTFFPLLCMLIEITPGEQSSYESLKVGQAIAEKFPCLAGKKFIVQLEKETTGLIANRISLLGYIYIDWLIDYAIDVGFSFEQLGALNFVFGLEDEIGLDITYNILKYCEEYLSPDFAPGKYLTNLVSTGRFGKKVGKGYYDYNENRSVNKQPSLDEKATEFLMPYLDEDIFHALRLNEACRLLEEGVVKSSRLIDKVMLKGYYVPGPFKLGKRKYREFAKKLYDLAEKTGKSYFTPCKLMESGEFLSY